VRKALPVAFLLALALGALLLGRPGTRPGPVAAGSPEARGASILRWTLASRAVASARRQVGVVPPGAGRRPLLVFLHGRGSGEEGHLDGAFLRALADLGPAAPAVVFPNGGEASFWHARASGDWVRYVLDEVVPEAARRLRADASRVAIAGISMGGFGALNIARAAPGRLCAAGGHSAAIWTKAGETAPGAFDDAADFARHDLVAAARRDGPRALGGAPVWLDVGEDDPFRPGVEALAAGLGADVRVWPGGHDRAYWRAHVDEYLRFYARALAACDAAPEPR
jgi:enterochelin esterase-like enzyme